jgi:Ca2+-binding RTX toxin-like protein
MVVALVAALMMTAGIALAESLRGDDGSNTIEGTNDSDRIVGLAGDDDLYGLGGADDIFGNGGADDIDVQGDGRIDEVDYGSGRDVVRANLEDNLDDSCEVSKAVEGPK